MIRASDGDGAPVAPPDAYPEGFHAWPIEKRNEFFANAVARLAPKRQTTAEVLRLDPKDTKPLRFPLERALDFEPPTSSDWLIKGLLPKEGIGTLFGASGEYKTFTAIHLCLHIATGEPWGGRKVKHTGPVVYIAVEGARGSKKRLQGIIRAYNADDPPIFQISKPINFGTSNEHAEALVKDIEAQGVKPVLIVVDTLSASMNGGEENGAGMSMFLSNCNRLSSHFGCFVLAVHHVGHNAEGREGGWSGLRGNVDTRISCTKPERLRASIAFEEVKDDEDGVAFDLRLEPVRFGLDEDGDPITTLAVMSAEEVDAMPKVGQKGRPPAQQRLFMDTVEQTMIDAGFECHPFPDGPKLRVASEDAIKTRYYARLAEKAEPTKAPEGLPDRQRTAFRRARNSAVNSKLLVAAIYASEPILWLPK